MSGCVSCDDGAYGLWVMRPRMPDVRCMTARGARVRVCDYGCMYDGMCAYDAGMRRVRVRGVCAVCARVSG